VSMVDRHGTKVAQTVPVGDDPRALIIDGVSGRIFVANDDDASVTVLDARTGRPLGAIPVGANPHAVLLEPHTGRAFTVNTGDGSVSMLDTLHARVLRTTRVANASFYATSAIDARRHRLFIGGGNSISVVDTRTMAVVSVLPLDETVGPLAVENRTGDIYALGSSAVYVLDPRTGRLLRTIGVDANATALALDERHGRLLVTSSAGTDANGVPRGDGTLQILDLASGDMLRRIRVGAAPSAVTVDAASGRTVVVDSGGQTLASDPLRWVPDWMRSWLPFLAPDRSVHTVPGSVTIVASDR
jgi:YVTN family beta-propeller protein